MTCVAAIVHDQHIYMGADSCGIDEDHGRTLVTERKCFRVGEFVLGYTTSFRMGQVLRYRLKPPPAAPGTDLLAYMCTDFVEAVKLAFHLTGCESGEFLVGLRGRLFHVEPEFSVTEALDGYSAVGCGEALALGSLHTSRGLFPSTRLLMALEAAANHNAGVAAPFHFTDV